LPKSLLSYIKITITGGEAITAPPIPTGHPNPDKPENALYNEKNKKIIF